MGKAYLRAATVSVAVNGFRKTGISPFNRFVFNDVDFAPAEVTDIPFENASVTNDPESDDDGPFLGFDDQASTMLTSIVLTESQQQMPTRKTVTSQPGESGSSSGAQSVKSVSEEDSHPVPPIVPVPSTSASVFKVSPAMIRPLPKSKRRKAVAGRKTEKSSIVTSSTHRDVLKNMQANKDIKQLKKLKRNSNTQPENRGKRARKKDKENLPQDTLCYYCGALFSASDDGQGWNQCVHCHSWVHNCTEVLCSCD